MKNDIVRDDVIAELDFDPKVAAAGIAVAVSDGVVTLSGHVPSYAHKLAATAAAQRVRGVSAVASELEVRLPGDKKRHDDEIAGRAVSVLAWSLEDASAVKVAVDNGWITLTGEVDWGHQLQHVERTIRILGGVRGVTNSIRIRPRVPPSSVREEIRRAFNRSAALESASITVDVEGATVTLSGKAKSWNDRRTAREAAWAVPGVSEVIDRIQIA